LDPLDRLAPLDLWRPSSPAFLGRPAGPVGRLSRRWCCHQHQAAPAAQAPLEPPLAP